MEEKDYLKLAREFSIKEWNFDIVLPAGEEDGWHYFSCTREGRPHYSSLPCAIRINRNGIIEVIGDSSIRFKISHRAHQQSNH